MLIVTNHILSCIDLQNVNITLRILFRPKPSMLPNIFMNIGEDYDERILPSITNEVLKAVVVSFLSRWNLATMEHDTDKSYFAGTI